MAAMSTNDIPRQPNGVPTSPSAKGMTRVGSSLYANLQLPSKPKRPSIYGTDEDTTPDTDGLNYVPKDLVQHMLNNVKDKSRQSHNIFCELDTLKTFNGNLEWRESARWVKFEEVVEEGGKRWSKPHVASLSMHAILETRKYLMDGFQLLDLDVYSYGELTDKLLDDLIEGEYVDQKLRQYMRDILHKKHKHSHNPRPKSEKQGKLSTSASSISLYSNESQNGQAGSTVDAEGLLTQDYKPNSAFMRKIQKDSEVCNIMVGELDELDEPLLIFVRLKEPRILEGVSAVKLPTRFLLFIFGPPGSEKRCREMGRCIATMMIDDVFREVAYKGRVLADLIAGLDEFVEQVTVLPPSEWNPTIRIEPPQKVQSQLHRPVSMANLKEHGHEEKEGGHGDDPALASSKIPFYGLAQDIKRKLPWYLSDFKDGIHVQCLASFIYVFLGTFTPNVTFGGLLGQATDQYMGVMECIFAAAITGILYALFAGQPLNIIGSTGPMLVLEQIIYTLCKDNGWDFMPARCWVGLWTAGFILLIVIFNLSSLVKYITRFTEDSFATLIAIIFIVEAFSKLLSIETDHPVNFGNHPTDDICSCIYNCTVLNATGGHNMSLSSEHMDIWHLCHNSTNDVLSYNWNTTTCDLKAGTWSCKSAPYIPDVFFFSVLLFLGTFGLAVTLKDFKAATVFPTFVRQLISDFAVLLSIIIFVVVDIVCKLPTPKLTVPDKFAPTRSDRGWLISPVSDKNPWWLALAAALPAILCVILVFLDQQITAVIVNRKEHKMRKGVGYHLDMLIICITIVIHSILGLPWYVAATVSALAHINSLKRESETAAPGEKPQFLGCREQRVTALAIGILSGAAVFITNILRVIPMAVLYGVFFYMGFSALRGMQFVDRLFLFIQPVKYQPDLPYLRHVQLYRVHIFTIIQILCLVVLWVVKSIKLISIGFPMMVLATGVVRKMMEWYYTQYELSFLDDLLPGKHAEKTEERKHKVEKINFAFEPDPITVVGDKPITGVVDKKRPLFFVDEKENSTDSTYHL
ncbi:sodium bicarbonate cotransporter 3-like [Dreissena polymorpha]|uniref:Anion exchange protein n=1 Tax=Dreissena polymorpha TaxID=45954 RepID=A0A9D4HEK6_DREPO|nr:sodium bicarbonate cotransporter 3-like [Dreissena polymorpha]KAH3715008.1 hypothetical protein DPMN_057711 [Dreissena polymorpha]